MVLDDSQMVSLNRQNVNNSRHLSLSSFNCVLSNSYTEIQQKRQKVYEQLNANNSNQIGLNYFRLIMQLFLAYFLLRNTAKFTNHENHRWKYLLNCTSGRIQEPDEQKLLYFGTLSVYSFFLLFLFRRKRLYVLNSRKTSTINYFRNVSDWI